MRKTCEAMASNPATLKVLAKHRKAKEEASDKAALDGL